MVDKETFSLLYRLRCQALTISGLCRTYKTDGLRELFINKLVVLRKNRSTGKVKAWLTKKGREFLEQAELDFIVRSVMVSGVNSVLS